MKKKLYFVKREVLATSIAKAIQGRGHIYEVTLAPANEQPVEQKPLNGFKK